MDIPRPPAYNALVVRPHISITTEERETVLKSVEYNLFAFPAALVTCDFLSDSGTSAMTDVQWAAMLRGDESYGRNWGYYCLLDAFRDVFERGHNRKYVYRDILAGIADSKFFLKELLQEHSGGFVNGGTSQLIHPNFFLVPQGRCAEALLFSTLGAAIDRNINTKQVGQHVIISNGFFDTTSANIAIAGFETKTFPQPDLTDAYPIELVGKENPFKGNLDLITTSEYLKADGDRVTMILLTITNNWAAAQPVSMASIKEAHSLARKYEIPLFFDACRFAENAKFIQDFEAGYKDKSIPQIIQEMFSYADGFTISLKKDGLANMGGALCLRDEGLFVKQFPDIGTELKERQIVCYGNDSYGGMSGRDIMAACVGLYEVTKEPYLNSRIGQVRRFAEKLVGQGIPVLLPPGGHAIFLDMDRFFAGWGRSYGEFAGLGFVVELLTKYGIRAMEAGPWGWQWDLKSVEDRRDIPNLVRFAVPRNVMNDEHINYTIAAITQLYKKRNSIPGAKIVRGKDLRIRHFSCGMEPVSVQDPMGGLEKTNSYLGKAQSDLSKLCSALGLDASWQKVNEALELSMHPWGKEEIPKEPCNWLSEMALDHSPIEYSVAIEQGTGAIQLRFAVEAQAEENTTKAYQKAAVGLTRKIQDKYPGVCLGRFDTISDIFLPSKALGPMAGWHSFALNPKANPEWKMYLNPGAGGLLETENAIKQAVTRLGMPEAYEVLEKTKASESDSFVYFSLDLHHGSRSRVKVYVQHTNISATAIADKIIAISSMAIPASELRRFCTVLAGGFEGPYTSKKLITCLGFIKGNDGKLTVEATLYFPVSHYAAHDGEIWRRVEEYISGWPGSEDQKNSVMQTYQRSIEAVVHRPLEIGRGIHAWVSLKGSETRPPVLTFYLQPEMFKVLE